MAKIIEIGSLLEDDINYQIETNNLINQVVSYYRKKDFKFYVAKFFIVIMFILILIGSITNCIITGTLFNIFNIICCTILLLLFKLFSDINKFTTQNYTAPINYFSSKGFNSYDINVKEAGLEGELATLDKLKELSDDYLIIYGYPIVDQSQEDYSNDCEIDFIVLGPNGAFMIENKNLSGYISGDSRDRYFTRIKTDNYGNEFEDSCENPIFQINRQLRILRNFLKNENLDIYFKQIVYFSNDNCELDITNTSYVSLVSQEDDLVETIKNFNSAPIPELKKKMFINYSANYIKEIRTSNTKNNTKELDSLKKEIADSMAS